jgi:hypothetical protein
MASEHDLAMLDVNALDRFAIEGLPDGTPPLARGLTCGTKIYSDE